MCNVLNACHFSSTISFHCLPAYFIIPFVSLCRCAHSPWHRQCCQLQHTAFSRYCLVLCVDASFFGHQPLLHWTVDFDLWQAWGRTTSSPRQQHSPRPPTVRSCRRGKRKANGEHFSNWSLGKRALKKGQSLAKGPTPAKGPIPAKGTKSKDTCQKCSN